MTEAFSAWVLEKEQKIDSKGLRNKVLLGNGEELENDPRLNREPMKGFQEWDAIGNLSRPCDNYNINRSENNEVLEYPQMPCYKEDSCSNKTYQY